MMTGRYSRGGGNVSTKKRVRVRIAVDGKIYYVEFRNKFETRHYPTLYRQERWLVF